MWAALVPCALLMKTMNEEYENYLKSCTWAAIRKRRFETDDYKCVVCGKSHNLNVHHIKYGSWGHESNNDLITLCENCHRKIHDAYKEADDIVAEAKDDFYEDFSSLLINNNAYKNMHNRFVERMGRIIAGVICQEFADEPKETNKLLVKLLYEHFYVAPYSIVSKMFSPNSKICGLKNAYSCAMQELSKTKNIKEKNT